MAPLEVVRTVSHDILPEVSIPPLGADETQLALWLDPTALEAPEVALVFTRALGNLPKKSDFTAEQMLETRALVADFRDAAIVARKGSIVKRADAMIAADPEAGDKPLSSIHIPQLGEDGLEITGGLLPPIPELVEAAKVHDQEKPETLNEFRQRVYTDTLLAEVPRVFTVEAVAIIMTGLEAMMKKGDKADITPDEIMATQIESYVLLKGIANAIYLPTSDYFLKISW